MKDLDNRALLDALRRALKITGALWAEVARRRLTKEACRERDL